MVQKEADIAEAQLQTEETVEETTRKTASAPPSMTWLISFTDVIALMLTFFVLLYSMSTPKEEDWEKFISSLQKSKGQAEALQQLAGAQDTISIDKVDFAQAESLPYLEALIRTSFASREKLADIVIYRQQDRLIISFPSNLLFESGSADVSPEGRRAIFFIGEKLANLKNQIEIIGHTDPSPITNTAGQFSSNWHLSLARAASVSGILQNLGYQKAINIRGLSSTQFEELPETYSESQRLDFARRTDIVILKNTGKLRSFLKIGQ